MAVFLPKRGRTYRYDFVWKKHRYFGSTDQSALEDAEVWESEYRLKLRRRAGGLLPALLPNETPRIQDWGEVYLEWAKTSPRITRPDRVEDLLRVVLRFWGAKPDAGDKENPPVEGEPYHDLHLGDAIADPDHVAAFEDWMDARGVAGQTKNQYRSTMSQMFKLALQPRYRKLTGVAINPFAGIFRDPGAEREVTIEPGELRRLLEQASYHVRLAVAIGALASKLRLGNILALRWSQNFDTAMRFITVHRHKTAKHTKRPLVIPISDQLRRILEDARRRRPSDYVVTYRGKPVKQIRSGLKAAAKASGLEYGRFVDNGLTFHTLRHTAATLLAELDVAESKRKSVMGHKRMETTQRYTHLKPMHEVGPLEQLSAALPIEDLVTAPWQRASRRVVRSSGPSRRKRSKTA